MQLPFGSWTETFRKLGYKRVKRKGNLARKRIKGRRAVCEQLERRELLAADLLITQFYSNGTDLLVDYDVVNEAATAFDIDITRAADGVNDDAVVHSARISDAADLAVGSHTLTIAPNFTDVQEDYWLLARIDAGGEVAETDETNNSATFDGGVFQAADGTIHVRGTSGLDDVSVTQPGLLKVRLNGVEYTYNASTVTEIHTRTHEGVDDIMGGSGVAKPMWSFGGAGDDDLFGGKKDDYLDGGDGDDYIKGRQGDDELEGRDGDDEIHADAGDDVLRGGDGNDELRGNENDDLLYGGAGADSLYGGQGIDVIYGDDGDDYIEGNEKSDTLYGGAGNDTIKGGYGADTIYGEDGDDTIEGNQDADTIYAGAGNDTVDAGYGNDLVYGGSGDDFIEGKQGGDTIYGEDGDDIITGDSGTNTLDGGKGIDTIDGVTDTNTAPTGDVANLAADEDTLPLVIDLADAFEDAEHLDSELTFTVVSNGNPALVTSAIASGTDLIVTVAADASGTADLTVRAEDPLNLYSEDTFTLTINAVNDAPIVIGPTPVNVNADEDDNPPTEVDLYAIFDDVDNADTELSFDIISNDNAALFTSVVIAGGALVLTHANNKHGQANIVLRATDPGGLSSDVTLAVVVNPVNDQPTTSGLADVSVNQGTASTVVDLSAAFADIDDASLAYTIESNTNPQLFVSLDIDETAGTLTLNYDPAATGTSDVTIRAEDSGGLFVDATFSVDVISANNVPTTSGISNLSVDEDAAAMVIDLSEYFHDIEDSSQGLAYEVVSNTNPGVVVDSLDGSELTLGYETDAYGTAALVIRATDSGGLSTENTLLVEVRSVNDAPVIGVLLDGPDPAIEGADLTLELDTVTDDSASQTVDFYRDGDGDGVLNTAVDQHLGSDSNAADGWSITVSTAGFGTGHQTYFAQATDAEGATSNTAMSVGSVGTVGVLDNAHPGYTETGSGWTDGTSTDSFDGAHRQHAAGTGANTARWDFTGLPAALHRISITWTADAANATDAPFAVYDGTTLLGTFLVDQTQAPASLEEGGQWWHDLGTFEITSGAITVTLSDDADGIVVADAVRAQDPPKIGYLGTDRAEVIAGVPLLLTAYDVEPGEEGGVVAGVDFYLDKNNDGSHDPTEFIGAGTVDGTNWTLVFDTTGEVGDDQKFIAVAYDNAMPPNEGTAAVSDLVDIVAAGDETNLVAHWKLNENSGTTVSDSKGGHTGTLHNSVNTQRDGFTGNGLVFDGVNDYVQVANPVNPAGDLSVSAWARIDGGSGFRAIVSSRDDSPGAPRAGYMVYVLPDGRIHFQIGNGTSWNGVSSSVVMPTSEWLRVTTTFDSQSVAGDVHTGTATVTVYDADGNLISNDSGTVSYKPNLTRGLRIGAGRNESSPRFFFNGAIDDVRIYDDVLSTGDILPLLDTPANAAPVIDEREVSVLIPESVSDQHPVEQIVATDPNNDNVTYQITDRNDNGIFDIDVDTGQVFIPTAAAWNSNPGTYSLTIQATDNGAPNLHTTAEVTVGVASLAANLVSHWKLDGNDATAVDSVGTNDGTLTNGPVRFDGATGRAVDFDGVNDYVQVTDPVNPDGDFSVSAWARIDGGSGFRAILSSRNDPPRSGYMVYVLPDGRIHFQIGNGTSWNGVSSSVVMPTSEWFRVTTTFDSQGVAGDVHTGTATVTVYDADGNLISTDSGTVSYKPNTTRGLRIGAGRNETSPAFYFHGAIDDVRVYDRVLTGDEAQALTEIENVAPIVENQLFAIAADSADGDLVGTVEASDANLNINPSETLTYSITEGDPNSGFDIDSETGMITIADADALDLANNPIYTLTVRVTDAGGLFAEGEITVGAGDVTTGLIGHWKLDDGAGTTAADSVGTNDGTLAGNPVWKTGYVGGSADFDGVNDYAQVADPVDPGGDFSLSAWARIDGGNGFRTIVSSRDDSPGAPMAGYMVYVLPNGKAHFQVGSGTSWNGVSSSVVMPTSEWFRVTTTFTSESVSGDVHTGTATLTVYDAAGNLISSDSGAVHYTPNTTRGLRIGAGANEGAPRYFFHGALDDVRVYDQTLSTAEIALLANAPPQLTRVTAPAAVIQGMTVDVHVEANDPSTTLIDQVTLYRDTNHNGVLEVGNPAGEHNDAVLGAATAGAGGWTYALDTTGLALETHTLLAQATNAGEPVGDVVAADVLVTADYAILDDGDPGYQEFGTGWNDGNFQADSAFDDDFREVYMPTGLNTATWTFDGLADGTYEIFATYTTAPNHATAVPFNVYDGLHDYADAEDDNDPNDPQADFSTTGDWTYIESSPAADGSYAGDGGTHGPDYTISDGTGGNTATSTHSTTGEGMYEVFVTWDETVAALGSAKYEIYDDTTLLGTVTLDQSAGPRGDRSDPRYRDTKWHSLGEYEFTTSTPKIVLSEAGGGPVVADGFLMLDVPSEHFVSGNKLLGPLPVSPVGSQVPDRVIPGVNQRTEPNDLLNFQGSNWESLGTVTISEGTIIVQVVSTGHADCWIIADAVMVASVKPITIAATNAIASEVENDEIAATDWGEFTVSRGEGTTDGDLTVEYVVHVDTTAIEGTDFNSTSSDGDMSLTGFVTIADGQSSATIDIEPLADIGVEWDEYITLEVVGFSDALNPQLPNYALAEDSEDRIATVTILDNDELTAVGSRNVDIESTGLTEDYLSNNHVAVSTEEGHVMVTLPLRPFGDAPNYRSDDNLHAIAAVEMQLPNFGGLPSALSATFTLGGIAASSVAFTNVNEIAAATQNMRFVLLGNETIFEKLRTGHYDYDVEFTATIGQDEFKRTVRGNTEVINLVDDDLGTIEFGKRWWVDSLDRLAPGDGVTPGRNAEDLTDASEHAVSRLAPLGAETSNGIAVIRGDNTSAWYESTFDVSHVADEKNDDLAVLTGDWNTGTYLGGYDDDYQYADTQSEASAAWTFGGLDPDRMYQVFTTWVPDANRASNAVYEIDGATEVASGETTKTMLVNQQYTPGELQYENSSWRSLGFYTGSSALTVSLRNAEVAGSGVTADGLIVADGVMLVDRWALEEPDGTFSTLDYDSATGEFTLANKYATAATFDALGLLQEKEDRNGNKTVYTYTDADATDTDMRANDLETVTDIYGLTTTYDYDTSGDGRLDTITDFAGRVTTFEIVDGLVNSVTEPDPDAGLSGYPSQAATEAPVMSFVYGGTDVPLLSSVTDGRGKSTGIGYDGNHRVSSVTNADSASWSLTPYLVDGIDDKIRLSATGEIGKLDTSVPGDLIESRATYTDARSNVWTSQLDAYGLETAMANPAAFEDVWLYERNEHGLMTKKTEPAGGGGAADTPLGELETAYGYDGKGNLTSVVYAQETLSTLDDPDTKISESWTYDATFSQMTSYTDGRGFTTTYGLDGAGNVQTISAPESVTQSFTYTPAPTTIGTDLPGGLVLTATDPRGVITNYDYFDTSGAEGSTPVDNEHGLVEKITRGIGGDSTIVSFNADDETTQHFTYDARRNPATMIQQMGNLDPTPGEPTGSDTADRQTITLYDNLGRLVKTTLPSADHIEADGTTFTGTTELITVYDGEDLVTQSIDQLGRITDFEYDGMRRSTKTILPAAAQFTDTGMSVAWPEITTTYDGNGNVTSTADPLGRTTTHTYDERNLRTSTTLPDPGTGDHTESITTFEYDTLGNLATVKDALHTDNSSAPQASSDRITKYEYDAIHRRTQETYPKPGSFGSSHDAPFMVYVYDDSGNVVEEQDALQVEGANRVTKYEFDGLNRNTKITQPKVADAGNGGAMTNPVTVITYDAASNVTNGKDAEGNDVVFDYDALNRRSQTTREATDDHGSPITRTLYNDASQPVAVHELTPGGDYRFTFYTYDDLGRNTLVKEPDVLDPVSLLLAPPTTEIKYDKVGKVRTQKDADGSFTAYYYDDLDRQIARVGAKDLDQAAPNLDSESFDADALRDQGYSVYTTAFDVANQRRQTTEFTNRNGAGANRVTDYAYDQQGRMVKVEQPDDGNGRQTNTYVFDAVGNQLEVHETINGTLTNITKTEFDNLNRVTKRTLPKPDPTDATNPVMSYVYDIASRTTKTIDTLGREFERAFDALNRVTSDELPGVVLEIIDQNDTGFATGGDSNGGDGDWIDSGSAADAHQKTQKELAAADGDGVPNTNFATWTFDHVENGKEYDVYITWEGTGGEDTVPVTITHNGVTTPVILLDQSVASAGFDSHNRSWALLGTIEATADADIVVKMTDDFAAPPAAGHDKIFADAVMLVDTAPVETQQYDLVSNMTGYVDALGRATNYVLDELYRVKEKLDPLTSHVDPTDGSSVSARATTTTTFDVLNRTDNFVDALGRTTSYTYDPGWDLTKTTILPSVGGSSPVWTNTYSLFGDLLTSEDPEGNTTTYTYTSDHQQRVVEYPLASDDPLYDDAIDDDNTTGGDFETTGTWNYFADPPEASAADSYAGDTGTGDPDYTISDGLGGNTATWDFGDLPEGGRYEVYATWDDALGGGNAQYQVFDGTALELTTGAIDQSSQPDDDYDFDDGFRWQSLGEFTFAAGTASVVLSEFDNGGGTYDQVIADGVRIRQIPPQTETIYNEANQVISQTDELGRTTTYEYDDRGRVVREVYPDPDGDGPQESPEMLYEYDLYDRVISETNILAGGNNLVTTYGYDDLHRRTSETDPNGDTTTYTYDFESNLLSMTDAVGNTTEYFYDAWDRMVMEIITVDGEELTRYYEYDLVGNLTKETDRNGRQFEYEYDQSDRLITERWIDQGVVTNTITTTYDQFNRVYSIKDDFSAYTYIYDDLDRVVEVRNFIDTNNDGDPSEVGDIDTPGVAPVILTYDYDEDDRLIASAAQIWDEDTNAWRDDYQNTYAYNNRDFLTSVTQQADTVGTNNNAVDYKRVEMIYDVADQLDQINRYASSGTSDLVATSSFIYDDAFRLDRLTHAQDTTVLAEYDWDYDSNNRVASFSSKTDGTTFYTYDDRDQLTGEFYVAEYRDADGNYQTISSGGYGAFQKNLAYQYDTNGNRYRRSETNLPDRFNPSHASFDPTTQFEPIGDDDDSETYTESGVTVSSTDDFFTDNDTHNRIETDGTYTYLFDDQGNRIAKFLDNNTNGDLDSGDTDIQEFEWDVRNRLTSVVDRDTFGGSETQAVDLIYDMMGRRIGMEVDSDGDGDVDTRERYVWDFLDGKGNVVLDFTDSDLDGTAEDHELSARYLWGDRVDQLFAQEEVADIATDGTTYWTLTDNLGTVRDLVTYNDVTDTTTVAEHYTYEAFGAMTSGVDGAGTALTGDPTTRYTFTAQESVVEAGLMYYDGRWYDTSTGQFLSADPIEFDTQNLYRYVGNSPTNATDPTGLREQSAATLKAKAFYDLSPAEQAELLRKDPQLLSKLRKQLEADVAKQDNDFDRSTPNKVTPRPQQAVTKVGISREHAQKRDRLLAARAKIYRTIGKERFANSANANRQSLDEELTLTPLEWDVRLQQLQLGIVANTVDILQSRQKEYASAMRNVQNVFELEKSKVLVDGLNSFADEMEKELKIGIGTTVVTLGAAAIFRAAKGVDLANKVMRAQKLISALNAGRAATLSGAVTKIERSTRVAGTIYKLRTAQMQLQLIKIGTVATASGFVATTVTRDPVGGISERAGSLAGDFVDELANLPISGVVKALGLLKLVDESYQRLGEVEELTSGPADLNDDVKEFFPDLQPVYDRYYRSVNELTREYREDLKFYGDALRTIKAM